MIKRLVELGFVDHYRCSGDKRRMLVGLTDYGWDRLEEAYGVAFTERYPAPRQPDGAPAPRHAYRLAHEEALGDKRYADAIAAAQRKYPNQRHPSDPFYRPLPEAPKKVGRDVARVFTTLAWQRAGSDRKRRLAALRAMISDAQTMARALGDTSTLIYRVPRLERVAKAG
jgi:hypothetical protein